MTEGRRRLLAVVGLGLGLWAAVCVWGVIRWRQRVADEHAAVVAESQRVRDFYLLFQDEAGQRVTDDEFEELMVLATRPHAPAHADVGLGYAVYAADTDERKARVRPLSAQLLDARDSFRRGQGVKQIMWVGTADHLPRLRQLAATGGVIERQDAANAVAVLEGRRGVWRHAGGIHVRDLPEPAE